MDYHYILGVSPDATISEITRAYRSCLLKHATNEDHTAYQKVKYAYVNIVKTIKERNQNRETIKDRETISETISETIKDDAKKCMELVPLQKTIMYDTIDTSITVLFEEAWIGYTRPIKIQTSKVIIQNGVLQVLRKDTVTLYIDIPQGTDDGEIIFVPDVGNEVNGQYKGVRVVVYIQNNTEFIREGLDVIYHKRLSIYEAFCGFSFCLSLCGKTYNICNDEGIVVQPESRRVIYGLGIKRNNHVGSLIIHFHVQFPTRVSQRFIQCIKSEYN